MTALANKLDGASNIVDWASSAAEGLLAPVDSLAARTQAAPLKSLLLAAVAGATLMAAIGFFRGSRPR